MQDETLDSGFPPKKLYKVNQVYWSTFLGGPLAGAYLVSENFNSLNEPDLARKIWIVVVLFCLVLVSAMVFIPFPPEMPKFIIPLAYSYSAKYYAEQEQKTKVEQEILTGAIYFSAWRTFLISIIAMLIFLACGVFAFFLFGKI